MYETENVWQRTCMKSKKLKEQRMIHKKYVVRVTKKRKQYGSLFTALRQEIEQYGYN